MCYVNVFEYLCISVFYICYTGMSYLIYLNPILFKNIAHVLSFKHFVFVYLQDVQGVRMICARFAQHVCRIAPNLKWWVAGSILDHNKH